MNENRVLIRKVTNLSNDCYKLDKINFDLKKRNGEWVNQNREVYDRGDGAAILLFNREKQSLILTKQFRLPSYVNGNHDGMMIEVCAGLLEKADPLTCIVKEAEEETGYAISNPKKVFEIFSTPGAVSEKIHYFIAEYTSEMQISAGGGLAEETEDIEVMELPIKQAYHMILDGEIKDAKTIILIQHLLLEVKL